MRGADLLVRELQARGVPFIAVLCGNGLDPLLLAASQAELRVVDTRNEQAASYVADAYARLTGRLGVCAVSSGVAHVNGLTGVLNAYYDGAPLLLISGASPSGTLGRGGFQDLDQVALARPICKYAEMVTRAERIPQALHEAVAAATSGRPGPVHLTISIDALEAPVEVARFAAPYATRGEAVNRASADVNGVVAATTALADAQRPLIVAGSGLFYARAGEALRQFVSLTRIPVVTPIWDRGVVNHPMEEFLGVIGAASGQPALLEEADLIVLAGARVDYRLGYLDSPPLAPEARILRISVDAEELQQGIEPDIALLADPRTAFEQLTQAWERSTGLNHDVWLDQARHIYRRHYARWARLPVATEGGVTGAQIVDALRQAITDDTLFLVDGGNIGQWAHMLLCNDRYPAHWLTCGASAVVGWGLPGAMGAHLSFPDRRVLLLSGDGAIGFTLTELASAARQELPFVCVLADDCAWGIVVSGQEPAYGCTVACEIGGIDYVQVANGLGAEGVRVERADEIAPAIERGFASGKRTLVHVPTVRGGPAD